MSMHSPLLEKSAKIADFWLLISTSITKMILNQKTNSLMVADFHHHWSQKVQYEMG